MSPSRFIDLACQLLHFYINVSFSSLIFCKKKKSIHMINIEKYERNFFMWAMGRLRWIERRIYKMILREIAL